MKKFINYLVLALGWLFVLVGTIGVFVPLLPTTPFLLLAGGCFSYASPRLKKWLHNHPRFGKILIEWETERVIPLYAKTIATLMMLTMVSYPLIFKPLSLGIKISVILSILLVLFYIWSKPSRPRKNQLKVDQKFNST